MVIVEAVVEAPARVPVGRWPLKFRTYNTIRLPRQEVKVPIVIT